MVQLLQDLVAGLARWGDAPALVAFADGARTDLNYSELDLNVRRLAAGLIADGIEPGEPVGIFAEESTRDWTHANSVVYDPERDAVIISSRHTNQVVAFYHLDDEGPQTQVRWILGAGATMPIDGDLTYYQHSAEVNPDGTLIIYDNGNFRPGTSPDERPLGTRSDAIAPGASARASGSPSGTVSQIHMLSDLPRGLSARLVVIVRA